MGELIDFMRNCIVIEEGHDAFLLTLWDDCGGATIVHDSVSYDLALRAAKEWDVPIIDRVRPN